MQNPVVSFSDAELRQAEAVTNALGLPVPCSGNFADVYQLRNGQRSWAVKCYSREIPGLRERYAAISKYLAQVKLPFKYIRKNRNGPPSRVSLRFNQQRMSFEFVALPPRKVGSEV